MSTSELPGGVRTLLDGERLEERVGSTLLLTVADEEGWPRIALLSVGEVLATAPDELLLYLYPRSRTTQALTLRGRAVLLVVLGGAAVRVQLTARRLPDGTAGLSGAVFKADVVAVEEDRVGYAELRHGIEFVLPDEGPVLARWREQVAGLRRAAAG